jgi:putative DNA primase/helicase
VIHAHAHDAAFISPLLTALSPTKRCGKSSLLRCVARLVPRPISTSNITPAAIYRIIEAASPTLLVDELDSVGDREKREDLRNILDASHCRMDARVLRPVQVGDRWEVRAFSAWAPIALAYIKAMPDTIRDRSIIIPMQRKAPDQAVAHMRLDLDQGFGELARKAARWAADHMARLRGADPAMPAELHDRAADNWRCLLAIADVAGGHWPDAARGAAVALSIDADDDDAIGIEALRDLQTVFETLKADRLLSSTIVAHLAAMEGRPWAEFGRTGKPITVNQLARLLKPFNIVPGSVRPDVPGDGTKGYKRESLHDLWKRYFQTGTRAQSKDSATFGDFQSSTSEFDVLPWNRLKAKESAACAVVPDENGPPREETQERNPDDLDRMVGEGARERIGTCAYCRDAAYTDDADRLNSGGVLHFRCTNLWLRSHPA